MVLAASRFGWLALSAFALTASGWLHAVENTPRTAPSRPATTGATATSATITIPSKKIAGIDYVSLVDAAAKLDLKLAWVERGKSVTLTARGVRAELENDTRDVVCNGLRVFLGNPITDAGGQLYVSRIDFERFSPRCCDQAWA